MTAVAPTRTDWPAVRAANAEIAHLLGEAAALLVRARDLAARTEQESAPDERAYVTALPEIEEAQRATAAAWGAR